MRSGKTRLSGKLYGLHLFLSYSHEDKVHAEKLKLDLEEMGAKVWQDYTDMDVGPRIDDQLRDALHSCHATVALISKTSLQSSWVLFEMGATWYAEKRLFPVCVDIKPAHLPDVVRPYAACELANAPKRLLKSLGHLAEKLTQSGHVDMPLLEAITKEAIEKAGCRKSKKLVLSLSQSLSPKIDVRRRGHGIVRADLDLRADFLLGTLELTKHGHERIRAEAYYCCGAIPQADGCFIKDEEFFANALADDESAFVKANCAQVLGNFIPLSPLTVELLEQCKIFARKADSNDYSELLYRIYQTFDENSKS